MKRKVVKRRPIGATGTVLHLECGHEIAGSSNNTRFHNKKRHDCKQCGPWPKTPKSSVETSAPPVESEPTKLQRLAKAVADGASGTWVGIIVTHDQNGGVAVIADCVFEWRGTVAEWQEALRMALEREVFVAMAERSIHPDEKSFAEAGAQGGMVAAKNESRRWLSQCHALLDSIGVPSGQIVDRVEALASMLRKE